MSCIMLRLKPLQLSDLALLDERESPFSLHASRVGRIDLHLYTLANDHLVIGDMAKAPLRCVSFALYSGCRVALSLTEWT